MLHAGNDVAKVTALNVALAERRGMSKTEARRLQNTKFAGVLVAWYY